MILLIDNYDSFTYNLAHLFGALGTEVTVRRNDEIDADEAERLAPSHLVVSPGPGRPTDAGASREIVARLGPTTRTLGVCLGHQTIVEAFGGEVGPAREIVHGKKRGFSIPAAAWLRGELEPFARDTLSDETLRRQGFFEPRVVGRLLDDHVAGREDLSRQLWGLLAFTLWHERHVEREPDGVRVPELLAER